MTSVRWYYFVRVDNNSIRPLIRKNPAKTYCTYVFPVLFQRWQVGLSHVPTTPQGGGLATKISIILGYRAVFFPNLCPVAVISYCRWTAPFRGYKWLGCRASYEKTVKFAHVRKAPNIDPAICVKFSVFYSLKWPAWRSLLLVLGHRELHWPMLWSTS